MNEFQIKDEIKQAFRQGYEQGKKDAVKHGHWIDVSDDSESIYECSECGDMFVLIEGTPKDNNYFYCPNCGTKMDGEE